MPGVWNVGNGYNLNSKKISRKLSFEAGEQFTGRVVSKGEGKDITIKLADGWQFIAELDGDVNVEDLKLVKFQVEGFENGKLKLKLISESSVKNEEISEENFSEVIEKEGLSKEDIEVLKLMVKHRIPLSKENISQAKGLIQLSQKMNLSDSYVKEFIENYISNKGLDLNSSEANFIREQLGNFFEAFKGMTSEEILTFIENNIEFSEENIKSFNELFKGDSSIEKIITNITKSLDSEVIDKLALSAKDTMDIISNKNNVVIENNIIKDNASALTKAYVNSDNTPKKLNMMELLKIIAVNSNDEKNSMNMNQNSSSLLNKLNDLEVMTLFKDVDYDSSEVTNTLNKDATIVRSENKAEFEKILSQVESHDIKLSDEQFKRVNSLFENKVRSELGIKQVVVKENFESKNSKIINDVLRNTLDNKDIVKSEVKGRIENVKEMVKNLIAVSSLKEEGFDKVINLIKQNMPNFKVFNSISNEYYYLNIPVTMENKEYPCKLIIKDNRKDGKKIDTNNAKMVVSVKTVNMGEVDGYLTLKDNKIDVNLKCESEFTSILNKNKVKLSDGLRTLGLFVNITVSTKEKPVDLINCREFFNDKYISTIDIKV